MDTTRNTQHPASSIQHPRPGFTLVELLVVITIIAILAALITVAAVGAMRTAQRTRIKAELDNISGAMTTYRDGTGGAFPPNAQTDGPGGPLDESRILSDLRTHMQKAFPRSREPEELLRALVGLNPNNSNFPRPLAGGMSAGEALVFWLSGASADPRYPISGEGGPAFPISGFNQTQNRGLDPVESRSWVFPFAIERLAPRAADGYFDESDNRFIEYRVSINGVSQFRRINFWQYVPANSEEPYLYFDVSRNPALPAFDPPAATAPNLLRVYAIKREASSLGTGNPIEFANAGQFQILHCGIDNDWGEDAFERMSAQFIATNPGNALLFPDGPFTGEIADTVTNFTTGTLEDAQP